MTRQQQLRNSYLKKLHKARIELLHINKYCSRWHAEDIDKVLDSVATAIHTEYLVREKPLEELLKK